VYFFATAGATLMAAGCFLSMIGLVRWQDHGPLLMLLPIVYVVAARLYRGQSAEQPLVWVSHTATVVMLVAALASAIQGFVLPERDSLNLWLALFFAEVALFYALCAGLHRQVAGIPLGAVMACGAIWQLFTYAGVDPEIYTLVFAVVGLALLVGYRLSLVEHVGGDPLATVAFQAGNVLLGLSFVSSAVLGLGRLATGSTPWVFVGLSGGLTVVGLLALALVRQPLWRRWYVLATLGEAALCFLGLTTLSGLSPWQKVEVFCVGAGLLLLVASHVGWYREQERESDLVSLGLVLGSFLVGLPLAIATLIDRSRGGFLWANEVGFLAAAVGLLSTGLLFRLRATTVVGALLTIVYFVTLLILVHWRRFDVVTLTVALLLTCGGGLIFGVGLALSVFRERLLQLPEKIRKREGVFRVLAWR
jgi:hypothetical protein